MKQITHLLGGVALLAFMGAGCNFTSLEGVNEQSTDSALSEVQEENAMLKKDLASLEKKLDKLEKDAQKSDEKEESLDQEDAEKRHGTSEQDDSEEEKKNLNERGREIIGELAGGTEDETTSLIALVGLDGEYAGDQGYLKFGCDDVLVESVISVEPKTQSDLATAIVQLLTHKPEADSRLQNVVRGKGFALENVKYEDGVRIIELSAKDVNSQGVCEGPRIKAQFEETIAMYAEEFEIRLNGTADAWRCLYDESGACSS